MFLHCGWPRTSTTSLQTSLSRHRGQLAAAGIVYPRRWISSTGPTHHGVSELLQESLASSQPLDDFKRFLQEQDESDVLISAEVLTFWLSSQSKRTALLALLRAACEVTPTKCVWTLRRLDQGFESLYLRLLALGTDLPPPATYFANIGELDQLFAGMVDVADAVGGEVAYARYDRQGTHNAELLRAFSIPEALGDTILAELDSRPRLNVGLTHKQAITLVHLDALGERAGMDFDRTVLRKRFSGSGFGFAGDRRCELVDRRTQRTLHERALGAARRQRFRPYANFFADAEIGADEQAPFDPDAITDDDLEKLKPLMVR